MTDAWIIELCGDAHDDSSKYLIWYEDEHGKNQVYTIDNKIACFASEQSAKNMIYKSDLCYMAIYAKIILSHFGAK